MQCAKRFVDRCCEMLAVVLGAALWWTAHAAVAVDAPTIHPASTKVAQKNMRLVGYSDLQGRGAYQPLIRKQGERWIAYVGHHGGEQLNSVNNTTRARRLSLTLSSARPSVKLVSSV